jgi:hypothetical protein
MKLPSLRRRLEHDLERVPYIAVFRHAQERRAALAAYETANTVLAVLRDEAPHLFDEKERLIRALLTEHHASGHPLWTTVLLLAFYPMLCHLRARMYSDAAAGDELDQLVVTVFLEILADYPIERRRDRTFLHVRQRTHRQVFRRLRAERQAHERIKVAPAYEIAALALLITTEHMSGLWPGFLPEKHQAPEPAEQAAQIAFLRKHAGALVNDDVEAVIATLVHGEHLPVFVERRYPHATSAERQRIYQRIKRHHTRTMQRLRQHLQPLHDTVLWHARLDSTW